MENKFLKKVLSAITSMAVALLFMTGIPFSKLDMSITASATATTLDVTSFNYAVSSSDTGWAYNHVNKTLSIDTGCEFTLTGGTFTEKVSNSGTIVDGSFSGTVTNKDSCGVIIGGTFSGTVTNEMYCTISGGTFTSKSTVNNNPKGKIEGGSFSGTVNNQINASGTAKATISDGTFKSGVKVYNDSEIKGGTFEEGSEIYNSGTIDSSVVLPKGTLRCAGSHTEGTPATCMTQAVCSVCGQSYGETAPHTFVDGKCSVIECGALAAVKYTYGGSTCYTDDFKKAVEDINDNNGGTITLRANINWPYSENVVVTQPLVLNLDRHTLDLGTGTLRFDGSIDASIIGTGTITSARDSNISESGQAVYVVGGASLTVGTENGSGPTISGGANAITTADSGANKLTVYSGTFNGACHLDSTGDYNNIIKGGTFNGEVYADWTRIDGGTFTGNINCIDGSCLTINNCECNGFLAIGQINSGTKIIILNGGIFKGGIENSTNGKTTDYLGADRYYVDEDGQLIEIADADDASYDIKQYVIVAPVHTVTFETNDYGGEDFEKKVADGFAVKEPTEPTDPNVSFGGWYKESALTTAWDFTNDKITSDVTIYAKWTANQVAQVETPVIIPASGTSFGNTLEVTITCATADAEIYYTTDGTTPTASSTKYTGAITLTDSKTIKAYAIKRGMMDSEVATADYQKNVVINPTPNPTPNPAPRPIPTPVFPPEDVSSEAGTILEADEVLINDGINPFVVIISIAGLVISSVAVARKRKKQ